ncbi:hypothetical protein [Streptomyces cinereoruber]|uniref:hypothetical protein n=1 Tax=Streptomyces cinereoruber TaxID=67260 RepID=UPI00363F0EC9
MRESYDEGQAAGRLKVSVEAWRWAVAPRPRPGGGRRTGPVVAAVDGTASGGTLPAEDTATGRVADAAAFGPSDPLVVRAARPAAGRRLGSADGKTGEIYEVVSGWLEDAAASGVREERRPEGCTHLIAGLPPLRFTADEAAGLTAIPRTPGGRALVRRRE